MDIDKINMEINKKSKNTWNNKYGVLGVTLTKELYGEFREYCKNNRYSMSGVIKVLIKNYLTEANKK